MSDVHRWSQLGKIAAIGCVCSTVMFLDSCDPAVQSVWEQGIFAAADNLVSVIVGGDPNGSTQIFADLISTAIKAYFTGVFADDDGLTTVQAAFEWQPQVT